MLKRVISLIKHYFTPKQKYLLYRIPHLQLGFESKAHKKGPFLCFAGLDSRFVKHCLIFLLLHCSCQGGNSLINGSVNKRSIGEREYNMGTGFCLEDAAQVMASPLLGGLDPIVYVMVSTDFAKFDAASLCSLSKENPPPILNSPE